MRRYEFNKLIRSKLPARMVSEGVVVNMISLNNDEYASKLKLKLVEEANEVAESAKRERVVQELADVTEVILALSQVYDITSEEIETERQKKLEINGHFAPENYVNYIEVAEDNKQVIDYLDNKDRPYNFKVKRED